MVSSAVSTSARRSQRISNGVKAAALLSASKVPQEKALDATQVASAYKIQPARAAVSQSSAPISSKSESNSAKNNSDGSAAPPAKKPRTAKASKEEEIERPLLSMDQVSLCTTLQQPRLTFDLSEAQNHLCEVDPRFKPLFAQMDLKLYKEVQDGELKELNLFRVLTTSIIGQKVSWMSARSVFYKFCRIFAPELEENPDFATLNRELLPFPSPLTVLETDDQPLRTAGISGMKVRYIRDVARRFADGRLDVRSISQMTHEECVQELIQAKGVGRWTAEMLLMFALRFPDVLPVGDIGVQRGMVNFYLSGLSGPRLIERKRKADIKEEDIVSSYVHDLPFPSTLLSLSELRARANGKKTKKGMYLDEQEMEQLAEPWMPYRSVACMFLWYLVG
ncbi:DNA-3-methyladenine glycosylase II [Malassezia psittaci]|uniref:DNA-3-methyladenine glycosylase II n=1 Tax=Malassezia psittaci TaxID=1821823 RepID=A0AAF0FC53_9BASI|nr:DNA-3-methyladenine glycosylase II [Malassezia psittaci]